MVRKRWAILILLLVSVREINQAPVRPGDQIENKFFIDLDLTGPLPDQIAKVYYPGCYDAYIYSSHRFQDVFCVINAVLCDGFRVYPGNKYIMSRNAVYFVPRFGLDIVHISSLYLDKELVFEDIEFYKTEDMPNFAENIKQLVDIDLKNIEFLPLTVEVRRNENGSTEVFVSDVFKLFIMIGSIKYGDIVLDASVHYCFYRSFVMKPMEDRTTEVNILSFLNNGRRAEVRFKINPNAEDEKDAVSKVSQIAYYLSTVVEPQ